MIGFDGYEQQMRVLKDAANQLFELAATEEEVYRLEKAINHEVMYLAALAQSERVKPACGWDQFGR